MSSAKFPCPHSALLVVAAFFLTACETHNLGSYESPLAAEQLGVPTQFVDQGTERESAQVPHNQGAEGGPYDRVATWYHYTRGAGRPGY